MGGNIGFDANGVLKMFDFGLSREISTDLKEGKGKQIDRNGENLYDLSGKIGTQRYMAPEVGCARSYNQKADVYSLSIVLWEILSLKKPFADHSKNHHRAVVLEGTERPPLDDEWPRDLRILLQCGWSPMIHQRPTMRKFRSILNLEIQALGSNEKDNMSSNRSLMFLPLKDSFTTTVREEISVADVRKEISGMTTRTGDSVGSITS